MTLVSVAVYQRLTGDTTTDTDTALLRLTDAQELVAEHLRRPVESAEHVDERLRLYSVRGVWTVYPAATPVTVVPSGYLVQGAAVVGAAPVGFDAWSAGGEAQWTTLTYTGGWTDTTVPITVARAIARTAQQLGQTSPFPAGARSVSLGDASASFDPGDAGSFLDPAVRTALRPYVRRRT